MIRILSWKPKIGCFLPLLPSGSILPLPPPYSTYVFSYWIQVIKNHLSFVQKVTASTQPFPFINDLGLPVLWPCVTYPLPETLYGSFLLGLIRIFLPVQLFWAPNLPKPSFQEGLRTHAGTTATLPVKSYHGQYGVCNGITPFKKTRKKILMICDQLTK